MASDDLLENILSDDTRSIFEQENTTLAPLLEEINQIVDHSIRLFVRTSLLHAPPSFWVIPGSFNSDHHPPDEHAEGGNILHIRRVARIVATIARAQERSQFETDILMAAAILHDLTKAVDTLDGPKYDPLHPYTVDSFIEWVRRIDSAYAVDGASSSLWVEEEVLNQILRIIRCHMGVWSPIPETIPVTTLEWTLHLADILAARLHFIVDGPITNEGRWKSD